MAIFSRVRLPLQISRVNQLRFHREGWVDTSFFKSIRYKYARGGSIPVFSNRSDTSTILTDIWHFFDIDTDTGSSSKTLQYNSTYANGKYWLKALKKPSNIQVSVHVNSIERDRNNLGIDDIEYRYRPTHNKNRIKKRTRKRTF